MSLLAYMFAPYDLLIIGVIVLLLFGNRLPSVMRSLGQGVTEFKKGLEGPPHDSGVDAAVKKSETPKQVEDDTAKS